MRLLTSLLLFFLFDIYNAVAQVNAQTVDIGEVTVEATRIRRPVFEQPVQIARIDSLQMLFERGRNLGEILARHSFLNIRSNGPGMATVISQRGFGGEHTRVLWEGVPINHQMLGLVNLSLIPAGAFSEVEVTSGLGSSLYGSGISGTVYLKNSTRPNRASLGQSAGSLGNYITNASASIQKGDFLFSLNGSMQQNANDFRYRHPGSAEVRKRERGAYDNEHLMGGLRWQRGNKSAKSMMWWNRANHEVAENIFAGPGAATQFDEAFRWVNSFSLHTNNFLWDAKAYAAKTTLNYFNPPINVESYSQSTELSSELSATWFASKQLELRGMLSATMAEVETNNYVGIPNRGQLSASLHGTAIPLKNLNIYPALRLDYYSDFGAAISPSLGMSLSLAEKTLALRASVSRNFRAPTFNDLYWPEGGNASLKPENGTKSEIGIVHEVTGRIVFSQQLSVFAMHLDDGIKWLPNSTGRFHAQNIQQIISRGAEWTGQASVRFAKWNASSRHSLSYTRAYIPKARFAGDQAVGRQLPYVPEFKYSGLIQVSHSGFGMMINGEFVDERFTSEQAGSAAIAEAYLVFDASFTYQKLINKTEISLSATVSNLFNEAYHVVRFYPMPLRNFLLNLTLIQHF